MYFEQAEAFPLVHDVIFELSREKRDWVRHLEIVQRLQGSEKSKGYVDGAFHRYQMHGGNRTKEGLAANMVAWWSKCITEIKEKGAAHAAFRNEWLDGLDRRDATCGYDY